MAFIPFQQSALFQNIASGGGTPLGPVPMNFPTATPYQWSTDPTQPDPDVPEDGFDMEVFCSLPANAGHPMCNYTGIDKNPQDDKDRERDYFSIKDMKNLDDESLINYLKDGWLSNSKLGFLKSKGDLVTVNKPLMGAGFSSLLALPFSKQNDMRRKFMIDELTKRGFLQSTDKDGNATFNINPQLYKKNLDNTVRSIKLRQDNKNDTVPIILKDGTLAHTKVDRTSGDYYQPTKPTSSHLTNDDGRRNEKKYDKALRENIVRSVKNTNPQIRCRYSKTLGGFTGGR